MLLPFAQKLALCFLFKQSFKQNRKHTIISNGILYVALFLLILLTHKLCRKDKLYDRGNGINYQPQHLTYLIF
jgi:hypothetical protein